MALAEAVETVLVELELQVKEMQAAQVKALLPPIIHRAVAEVLERWVETLLVELQQVTAALDYQVQLAERQLLMQAVAVDQLNRAARLGLVAQVAAAMELLVVQVETGPQTQAAAVAMVPPKAQVVAV